MSARAPPCDFLPKGGEEKKNSNLFLKDVVSAGESPSFCPTVPRAAGERVSYHGVLVFRISSE